MFTWPPKDPDAVLDYEIDWADQENGPWLQVGETLTASTWTVVEGHVVIDSSSFTAQGIALVWLSGGTLNEPCILTNHVTTSAGREDDRSVRLRIRSR